MSRTRNGAGKLSAAQDTLYGQIPLIATDLAKAMIEDMKAGRGVAVGGELVLPLTVDLNGPDGMTASLSLVLRMKQTS